MEEPHDEPEENDKRQDIHAKPVADAIFSAGREYVDAIPKAQAACTEETFWNLESWANCCLYAS